MARCITLDSRPTSFIIIIIINTEVHIYGAAITGTLYIQIQLNVTVPGLTDCYSGIGILVSQMTVKEQCNNYHPYNNLVHLKSLLGD